MASKPMKIEIFCRLRSIKTHAYEANADRSQQSRAT